MLILRSKGLTLTTPMTRKKENYHNLFFYSQSEIFVFFFITKVCDVTRCCLLLDQRTLETLEQFFFFSNFMLFASKTITLLN